MPLSLRTSLKRLAERATGTAHLHGQRAVIAEKLAAAKTEPVKAKSMPAPPATAITPFDDPATVAWFADGGLVPFPAAEPRTFVRTEDAIRLEAGLLLDRARAEFSRRYLVRADATSDEARAGYTRVLQGQLRIAELEAAARDPEDEERFWGADEDLVENAAEIGRLDDEIKAALSRKDIPRPEDASEHRRMQVLRQACLQRVMKTSARRLAGLKAKARVILGSQVRDTYEDQRDVAESLASDLLRIDPAEIEGEPDPILEQIAEGRRLMALAKVAEAAPQDPGSFDPPDEFTEAQEAAWAFFRGPLLYDPPINGPGCQALAQFALDFIESQGGDFDEDGPAILRLIAACRPAVTTGSEV